MGSELMSKPLKLRQPYLFAEGSDEYECEDRIRFKVLGSSRLRDARSCGEEPTSQ